MPGTGRIGFRVGACSPVWQHCLLSTRRGLPAGPKRTRKCRRPPQRRRRMPTQRRGDLPAFARAQPLSANSPIAYLRHLMVCSVFSPGLLAAKPCIDSGDSDARKPQRWTHVLCSWPIHTGTRDTPWRAGCQVFCVRFLQNLLPEHFM